jgi:hypothetical protein
MKRLLIVALIDIRFPAFSSGQSSDLSHSSDPPGGAKRIALTAHLLRLSASVLVLPYPSAEDRLSPLMLIADDEAMIGA